MSAALTTIDEAGPDPSGRLRAERVRAQVTLALSEFLLRGSSVAMRRLDDAESAARQLGADALVSRVEYQRATIHGRDGNITAAWQALQRVMSDLSDFSERERCSVLINHGMVAFAQGRAHDAAASFASAAELARTQGFPAQEAMARHNHGYALYLQGHLPKALALMAEAERAGAVIDQGLVRLDRAHVLLEAGLVSEAINLLRSEAQRSSSQLRVAETDLMLARAYAAVARLAEAAAAGRRAEEGFRALGSLAWAARARLINLQVGFDAFRSHRDEDSGHRGGDQQVRQLRGVATSSDEVRAVADDCGDVDLVDRARTLAAQALIEAGDLDAAAVRLEPGRIGTRRSLAEDLNRVSATAQLAVAAGEQATARRLLTRAAGRLAASGRGSASLDLRTASAVHGTRLAAFDLDLSRERGPSAVLASLERWRSVFTSQPSILPADDPVVAELTEQLRSVQRAVRDDPSPAEMRRLQRRAGLLEDRIRNRDWSLSHSELGAQQAPVRIREARARLKALDRDLVWFFSHRGRLCGVGIVNGRATVRDLMDLDEATELARQVRVDLRTATTQLLGPFRAAVWGSLRSVAERLDAALIRPWQSSAGGMVLCTDRSVSTFPWQVLPSLQGVPVTVSLSLTSYATKSTMPSGARSTPAVHVAVGPGLERGHSEAEQVADLWSHASVEFADPSSSAALLSVLRSVDVVHVAAHGSHVKQSPLFSTITLHDGPVFAYEAQRAGVNAGHVVLSACEVGEVTVRPGEESLGMAVSLLSLGARSVVAAVSPVPDDVAAEVMVRHHRGLAQGLGSDEALAAAVAGSDPAAVAFVNLGGRFATT